MKTRATVATETKLPVNALAFAGVYVAGLARGVRNAAEFEASVKQTTKRNQMQRNQDCIAPPTVAMNTNAGMIRRVEQVVKISWRVQIVTTCGIQSPQSEIIQREKRFAHSSGSPAAVHSLTDTLL
jgi:hypothetical protein